MAKTCRRVARVSAKRLRAAENARANLGRIEQVEDLRAANELVRGESAIGVRHAEDDVDSVAETLLGDELRCAAVKEEKGQLAPAEKAKERGSRDVLQHNDGLHALCSTIADGVALLLGRERPSTLGRMPVGLPVVARVLANLAAVEPLKDTLRAFLVLLLVHQASFDDGLGNERRIPKLAAVGSCESGGGSALVDTAS